MKYTIVSLIIIIHDYMLFDFIISFCIVLCRWRIKTKHFLVNWNSLLFLSRCAFSDVSRQS